MACVFCDGDGGAVLWRDTRCRVVRADEPDYPAFCRVIWNTHVREMSDLSVPEREHYMRVVFAVESALREILQPEKINVASLGNGVPHLHWHVIARFRDDRHFPTSVWSAPQREALPRALPQDFEERMRTRLAALAQ